MSLQVILYIKSQKQKMTSFLVTVLYFIFSISTYSLLYWFSLRYSGSRFRWKWCWSCVALTVCLGAYHMGTIEHGYIGFFPEVESNVNGLNIVGWTAFISIFFLCGCIPTQFERRPWFLIWRKKFRL